MKLATAVAVLVLMFAASLVAAEPCRPEWTQFNCAIYRMGIDEQAVIIGATTAEQDDLELLIKAHGDIFWTARAQELHIVPAQRSHDMASLNKKINDYRIVVRQLQQWHMATREVADRLIVDSVDVENALRAPGPWFKQ